MNATIKKPSTFVPIYLTAMFVIDLITAVRATAKLSSRLPKTILKTIPKVRWKRPIGSVKVFECSGSDPRVRQLEQQRTARA